MPRRFSREFKEAAVRRIIAGAKVQALATELDVWPKLLYAWRNSYDHGGADALLPPGRPRNTGGRTTCARPAPRTVHRDGGQAPPVDRVVELERKVGQQALELDFFARALRHIKASRRPSAARGGKASST